MRALALAAIVAVVAVIVWWIGPRQLDQIGSGLDLPWWPFVVAFFVAESFVVHLHFRSESGTFSLVEFPLVFALLFADPGPAVVAMLAGSLGGLAFVRQQPVVKLAFNLANLALHFSLVFLLLEWFLAGQDPLTPFGWTAILGATTVAATINFSMILLVIGLTEGRFEIRRAGGALAFCLLISVANTVQALIAVLVILAEPAAIVLFACSALVLFVAYRAYVAERTQREQVEFLYASTRALREGGSTGAAMADFVTEAAEMFRASTVALYLFPAPGSDEPPVVVGVRDQSVNAHAITEPELMAAKSLAEAAAQPICTDRFGRLTQHLADHDVNEAMVSVLASSERELGVLLVGDRLGNVSSFTKTDLELFSTLVEHAAVALENDQLGQALDQLRELGQVLEHQARYDELTGLPNRPAFHERLDELFTSDNEAACLLYVDLDDFKPVNDSYGHAAGDALLSQAASRIEGHIRSGDLAARLGGDEFAVLLESGAAAEATAQRLIGALSTPFRIGTIDVRIGASVGLAHRADCTTSNQLLRRADVALYAAKEHGKGAVTVYGDHLRDRLDRRQTLQSDLRRAIANSEFEVHYQPIIRLEDEQVVGAEALVRWRHPSGSLESPAGFIEEAEQSGLIVSVDRLVRTEVFDEMSSFLRIAPGFHVAINISARHLLRPGLIEEIASDLRNGDAPAESVVFELTETALARDVEAAARRLDELRALGPRIAIDDFGTGYASLNYLRTIPADVLKIAQPFIHDMAAGDRTFVSAIVGLGHDLGFTMLAEGIESGEAVDMLRHMGCDLAQGFYYARPMPATELAGLLEQQGGLSRRTHHS